MDYDNETLSIMKGYAGQHLLERQYVTVEPFDVWGSEEWTLAEFQQQIADAVASIPADCVGTASVELAGGYDESTRLTISYRRPETDEEMEVRISRAYAYAQETIAKERRTYAALKQKFGE